MLRFFAFAMALALGVVTATGQDFPAREIKLVVPYSPGGATDTLARFVQELAGEQGVTVVVENLPGGGGVTGISSVLASEPDGYTVSVASSTVVGLIATGTAPISLDQFDTIVPLALDTLVLAVPGNSPYQTLEAFMQALEKSNGTMTLGAGGSVGGVPHIASLMTAKSVGTEFRFVGYPGAARLIVELSGGQLDAGVFKPVEVLPYQDSGELKVLGVYADERIDALPDVPTFKELGIDVYPNGPILQMTFLLAPAGMPADVKEKLISLMSGITHSEPYLEYAKKNSIVILDDEGEDLDALIKVIHDSIVAIGDEIQG